MNQTGKTSIANSDGDISEIEGNQEMSHDM